MSVFESLARPQRALVESGPGVLQVAPESQYCCARSSLEFAVDWASRDHGVSRGPAYLCRFTTLSRYLPEETVCTNEVGEMSTFRLRRRGQWSARAEEGVTTHTHQLAPALAAQAFAWRELDRVCC